MKWLIALGALTIGGAMWLFMVAINHTPPASAEQKHYTMSVCDKAHLVMDGRTEELCGELQDKYHIDYKCSSVTCWVE